MTRPDRRALVINGLIVLCVVLIALSPWWGARAHEAYDYRCCGQNDCAPVEDRHVHEAGDVIVFRIPPGSHPMWPADKVAHLVVEIDRFRIEHRRLDGRWHLCLSSGRYPLCTYRPQRSF